MLVQFSVQNFLSFDRMENFSLRATKDERLRAHVWTNPDGEGGRATGVTRGAAIYGANAAGKSNLVRAMALAQHMIVHGSDAGKTLPFSPFKLNSANAGQPTRFEFYFRSEGTLFSYGFAYDGQRIHEEWLFGTAKKHEARWFERTTNESGQVSVEFGPSLRAAIAGEARSRGFKGAGTRADNLASDTRANQLFLSACIERNVGAIAPVRRWFDQILTVISAESPFEPLILMTHIDRDFAEFIGDFLRDAGTGIQKVETKAEPLDLERHFPGADSDERADLEEKMADVKPDSGLLWRDASGRRLMVERDENGQLQFISFWTLHRDSAGELVRFRLEEESDGTQRLFDLVPTFFMRRMVAKVWVIDELDRRLHTHLTRLLLEYALDCPGEQPCGQFIATTHDTNLLDLELLRRDEIWLVEKGDDGASHLATLAEWRLDGLSVRPDLDIESGYLRGRFGGVPRLGRLPNGDRDGNRAEFFADERPVEEKFAEAARELVGAGR